MIPEVNPELPQNPVTPRKETKSVDSSFDLAKSLSQDVGYHADPFANKTIAYKPFERYKGNTIDISKPAEQIELDLSSKQSYWERLGNDLKVAGGNAAAMFGATLMTLPDMLSGNFSLDGTENPTIQKIYDWRNEVDKNNTNFETKYDQENPILSYVIPAFITGSSKGWGDVLKSGAYGIGAIAGIALEEIAITAATEGIGTLPSLAANITRALKMPKSLLKVGEIALDGLKTAEAVQDVLGATKQASSAIRQMKGFNLAKDTSKFLARGLASAYGEASFEGLEATESLKSSLLNDFRNKNGREPNDDEYADIDNNAKEAGSMRYYTNMGLLTLTGGFEMGQIFKPFSATKNLAELGERVGLKTIFNPEKKILEGVDDAFRISGKSSFWNNKLGKIIKAGTEGTVNLARKANVGDFAYMEGVEEFSQLWIDKATKNYYVGQYDKDVNQTVLNSVLTGLDESISKEGFIAALTGIMGGSMQSALFKGIPRLISNVNGTATKERLSYENQLKNLNEVLGKVDTQQLIKASNLNSLFGTLTNKGASTKAQVHSSLLENVVGDDVKDGALTYQSFFNLVAPWASNGYTDIYKEYLNSQFSDAFEGDQQSKEKVKNEVFHKIDAIGKIYNEVNSVFKNPYEVGSEEYNDYNDWKRHVVGHKFTQSKLEEVIKSLPEKLVQDTRFLNEPEKLKVSLEQELKEVEDSLSLFSEAIGLDQTQKKLKKEELEKKKNLLNKISLIDRHISEDNDGSAFMEYLKDVTPKESLGESVYYEDMAHAAFLIDDLNEIKESYKGLLSTRAPKDVVSLMNKFKKEASKINEKKNEIVEVVKNTMTKKDKPLEEEEELEETPPTPPEDVVNYPQEKDEHSTRNTIRSKLQQGLFNLVFNKDKEVWEIKGYSKTPLDSELFLNKLLQGNLKFDEYEIVKVTNQDLVSKPLPKEPGILTNSQPSYHYALVKKGDSLNKSEIAGFRAPDALMINPDIHKALEKMGFETKDMTLNDLALQSKDLPLTDENKAKILDLIYGINSTQDSFDEFTDIIIAYYKNVELLHQQDGDILFAKNLFDYKPLIYTLKENKSKIIEGSEIPFHFIKLGESTFSKPILIIENKEWKVYGRTEAGIVEDITETFKKEHPGYTPSVTKDGRFAILPTYGFKGKTQILVAPLYKNKKNITKDLISLFEENVQDPALFSSSKELEKAIQTFVREETYVSFEGKQVKYKLGVSYSAGDLILIYKDEQQNQIGKTVINLKKETVKNTNLEYYVRVSDKDINSPAAAMSDAFYTNRSFETAAVNIVPKGGQIVDVTVSVPKQKIVKEKKTKVKKEKEDLTVEVSKKTNQETIIDKINKKLEEIAEIQKEDIAFKASQKGSLSLDEDLRGSRARMQVKREDINKYLEEYVENEFNSFNEKELYDFVTRSYLFFDPKGNYRADPFFEFKIPELNTSYQKVYTELITKKYAEALGFPIIKTKLNLKFKDDTGKESSFTNLYKDSWNLHLIVDAKFNSKKESTKPVIPSSEINEEEELKALREQPNDLISPLFQNEKGEWKIVPSTISFRKDVMFPEEVVYEFTDKISEEKKAKMLSITSSNASLEQLDKIKQSLLASGEIKEKSNPPSERNMRNVLIDVDTQVKQHLKYCHGQ